ncbi:MAG: hypothetical protein U9R05_04885 [Chloroflexota bacterium]|nr:hypothetical protein [Chloroflexota bacterium]
MELELRFVPNAFKHSITEDEIWGVFLNQDIKCVIIHYKNAHPETIYNAYGVTEDGRYLEIGYVKETVFRYRIIHAMDMRKSARRRFKKMRRL